MLARAATLAAMVSMLVAAATALGPAAAADDDGGGSVECPPNQTVCVITVHQPPGSGGDGGGSGGSSGGSGATCTWAGTGQQVPCYDDRYGWWSEVDSCYYQRLDPPPPVDDPSWAGHYPNGAIYQATCLGSGGSGGGWVWLASPPEGYGGTPITADQLAARAVKRLPIDGPAIGIAPHPDGVGLVGLPVWLWTSATARTWGPASATASVPGLSVTATARAERVVWSMGDGHSVTCTSPGSPYTPARGGTASPSCGYVYRQSSAGQAGGKYTVTATTTWLVTWAGGGATGSLTVTRSSSVRVAIGELQVVVS